MKRPPEEPHARPQVLRSHRRREDRNAAELIRTETTHPYWVLRRARVLVCVLVFSVTQVLCLAGQADSVKGAKGTAGTKTDTTRDTLNTDFQFLTGAEISSAQTNFSSSDTRLAASASYRVWLSDRPNSKLIFTTVVNLTSSLQLDFSQACQPGLQRKIVGSNIPNVQPPGTPCGVGTIKGDTLSFTVPTVAAVKYTTAKSVRVIGSIRREWRVGATNSFFGPVLSGGFQTNPDAVRNPNVIVFGFGGFTLTYGDSKGKKSLFRLDLLGGWTGDFADTMTVTLPIQAQPTGPDTLIATLQPFRHYRARAEFRLLAEPLTGYYIRGFAIMRAHGPDMVQVAFLKELDIAKVISSILGRTSS